MPQRVGSPDRLALTSAPPSLAASSPRGDRAAIVNVYVRALLRVRPPELTVAAHGAYGASLDRVCTAKKANQLSLVRSLVADDAHQPRAVEWLAAQVGMSTRRAYRYLRGAQAPSGPVPVRGRKVVLFVQLPRGGEGLLAVSTAARVRACIAGLPALCGACPSHAPVQGTSGPLRQVGPAHPQSRRPKG